jgi:hypothetical protein
MPETSSLDEFGFAGAAAVIWAFELAIEKTAISMSANPVDLGLLNFMWLL